MTDTFSNLVVIAGDAAGSAGGQGQGGDQGDLGGLWTFAPIILIMVLFFWMTSRSQKKRQQERKDMLAELQVKDDVITIGGIQGRIVAMDDQTITLRVDPEKDIKMTFVRTAISGRQGEQEEA